MSTLTCWLKTTNVTIIPNGYAEKTSLFREWPESRILCVAPVIAFHLILFSPTTGSVRRDFWRFSLLTVSVPAREEAHDSLRSMVCRHALISKKGRVMTKEKVTCNLAQRSISFGPEMLKTKFFLFFSMDYICN